MLHKLLNIKLSISLVILLLILSQLLNEVKLKEQEITNLNNKLEDYQEATDKLLGIDLHNLQEVTVTVSSYNPVRAQTDDTPLYGNDGGLVSPGTVAISKDLRKKYKIRNGDRIILDGLGAFVVKDSMNSRWKRRVDIISFSKTWSKEFGIKENVSLYFNRRH